MRNGCAETMCGNREVPSPSSGASSPSRLAGFEIERTGEPGRPSPYRPEPRTILVQSGGFGVGIGWGYHASAENWKSNGVAMPFKPGQSGNPAGKRPAETTLSALRKEIAGDARAILRMLIEKAKEGDIAAAKLVLDRVVPALKLQELALTLPALLPGGTLADQGRGILAELAAGTLAPGQAAGLLSALAAQARLMRQTSWRSASLPWRRRRKRERLSRADSCSRAQS